MTISADYLEIQKELHKSLDYGVMGAKFAPLVLELAQKVEARSISDYGAGKCGLKTALHELDWSDFDYFPYDPAFPEYGEPRTADIVCCIDVLEHIEPIFLDAVLQNLRSLVFKFGFFSIHSKPALKTLPDGRNAHLIQKPISWWQPKFEMLFKIFHLAETNNGFWLVVGPRHIK